MAIDPSAEFPGQVDTSDPAGYPHGAAQDVGTPGDGTGTPWEKRVANDLFGMQQALLDAAGITPSGTPDKVGASDYLDAIQRLIEFNGGVWADAAVAKNWPYRFDFTAYFGGAIGVTAALWDTFRHRWNLFTYDGSNNPLGQYAQGGFGAQDDGNDWVEITIPAGSTLRPLCAATDGAGVIVLGGTTTSSSAAKLRETSDGDTWNTRSVTPTGTTGVRALVWHEASSLFLAGLDVAAATNIETSPDGQAWTQLAGLPNTHARGSFATDGTVVVATAYDTSTDKCLSSTDGSTWTERTLPTTEKWLGVLYDTRYERFLAFGVTTIAVSDDGATWTSAGAHGLSISPTTSKLAILGRIFCVSVSGSVVYIGHVVDTTISTRRVMQTDGSIKSIAAGDHQLFAGDSSEQAYWTIWGGDI